MSKPRRQHKTKVKQEYHRFGSIKSVKIVKKGMSAHLKHSRKNDMVSYQLKSLKQKL